MERFTPLHRLSPVDFDPFAGPSIQKTLPTTEPQREVFVAAMMGDDAACAYNESVSVELDGPLDRARLQAALLALEQRHEGLRSVFSSDGLKVLVLSEANAVHGYSDLSSDPNACAVQDAFAQRDMTTPFNPVSGPIWRTHLFRLGSDRHVLRITGHHVVCDGWSLGMIVHDLSAIYSGKELPPAVSLSDFVRAVELDQRSAQQEAVRTFWTRTFRTGVPRMDLPTDRPRPSSKTYAGERIDVDMPAQLVQGIRSVATRNGASLVTTLLTVFETLLYRITGQTDLVVGLPAAGQNDRGMRDLVAHCVNLLPLRSSMDPGNTFADHLRARRGEVLDAFDHQRFTFGTLVRMLNVPREPGRIPLVPVVFNVDMNMDAGVAFTGLRHRLISNPRKYEHFELYLNATGNEDRLTLEWSYNTDLFDRSTIERWINDLNTLVERVIAEPDTALRDLAQSDPQHAAVPAAWCGQSPALPSDAHVPARFAATAQAHPQRIALEFGDQRMDYATLQQRVWGMAEQLLIAGVRPGDRVGICADKGPEAVTAMLAILHIAAVFVPLDPGYPEERLRFMIRDTQICLLLTQAHLPALATPNELSTLLLERMPTKAAQEPAMQATPDAPAYIMYTSGSTGQPKGVTVPHRAIVRLVNDQDLMVFDTQRCFLQLSNMAFDASTLEIWGALLNGARLVFSTEQKPSLQELITTIHQHRVDTLWLTAGLFNLVVDEHLDDLRGMRTILAGGDALSVAHVRKALKALGPDVLINGYGPTENTTFTTCHRIGSVANDATNIPIGKPIAGTTVHVLRDDGSPAGIGEEGELYTGGNGLALGYWQRPELDAERFVTLPDHGTERFYRTGDRVRWNKEGAIEFLGRNDGQVKIRGFRVELDEIANLISTVPGVKDRVVTTWGEGADDKVLACYLVPHADHSDHDALLDSVREHLRAQLPPYMVPAEYTILPALPLTPNGKVDKRALPRSTEQRSTQDRTAPRNRIEQELANIWQDILEVERVGVHDNFFDLGGHSLSGIRMLARVEEQLGLRMPLKSLFRASTLAAMAAELVADHPDHRWTNLSAIRPEGSATPLFCVNGDEANLFLPRYLEDRPFYGFFHQGEDGSPLQHTSVEAIAEHFLTELRQARPIGPYLLMGYSFGGLVAYEMACRLQAMGEEVPFLGLLDTYAPHHHDDVLRGDAKWYDGLKRATMRAVVRTRFAQGEKLPVRLRHFNIIDTYNRAIGEYRPKAFRGTVTLFRADAPHRMDDMGWSDVASVEVVHVPGDHFTMIKEPAVGTLGKRLAEQLEAAEALVPLRG